MIFRRELLGFPCLADMQILFITATRQRDYIATLLEVGGFG